MNSFTSVFIPVALLIAMTQMAEAQELTVVPSQNSSNEALLLDDHWHQDGVSSTSDNIVSLIDTGLGYLGIPLSKRGDGPESGGFDCSGLVKKVFGTSVGLSLPRTSVEMAKVGDKVNKQGLIPGDLVFFNTMNRAFSHVGIYLGESRFLHSPTTGGVVRIESMDVSYWRKRFNGGRRVVEPTDER